MKAVLYEGPRQVTVKDVPDARIERPTDVLVRITAAGKAEPSFIVSHELPLDRAPGAYEHFDARDDGWTEVVLHPAMVG
jgi:glutathione-independent formaldehyde dehydrogenase